jgi:hypothetical protein
MTVRAIPVTGANLHILVEDLVRLIVKRESLSQFEVQELERIKGAVSQEIEMRKHLK